ncbi:hypothetical protein N9M10_04670 [Hellea sp.]|nr:hypothetical protein [Hellea sp.]
MIMIGLFFWVMAVVNYGIHRMHQKKAEELLKERESLTAHEALEKNKKAHQQRLSAIKSTLLSTGFLAGAGMLMVIFALVGYF